MKGFIQAGLVLALSGAGMAHAATELVVATVNNGHMIEMQKLTPVLREGPPRHQAQVGHARRRHAAPARHHRHRHQGRPVRRDDHRPVRDADLVEEGLAQPIATDAAYDVDDLLPAIRAAACSADGKLYAAPFYGESSMLMYRKDLADKVGFKMPDQPTWAQVKELAGKIHDPKAGVYGMLPARQAGLGRQHGLPHHAWSTPTAASGSTCSWKPQIDTKPWKDAIGFYVDLDEGLRPARRLGQQLQREPRALQRRQVRDVGGRHHRGLVHQRSEAVEGGRQGGLRAGARRPSRPRAPTGCGPGALAIPASSQQGRRRPRPS